MPHIPSDVDFLMFTFVFSSGILFQSSTVAFVVLGCSRIERVLRQV
jgi:hypothetical protein